MRRLIYIIPLTLMILMIFSGCSSDQSQEESEGNILADAMHIKNTKSAVPAKALVALYNCYPFENPCISELKAARENLISLEGTFTDFTNTIIRSDFKDTEIRNLADIQLEGSELRLLSIRGFIDAIDTNGNIKNTNLFLWSEQKWSEATQILTSDSLLTEVKNLDSYSDSADTELMKFAPFMLEFGQLRSQLEMASTQWVLCLESSPTAICEQEFQIFWQAMLSFDEDSKKLEQKLSKSSFNDSLFVSLHSQVYELVSTYRTGIGHYLKGFNSDGFIVDEDELLKGDAVLISLEDQETKLIEIFEDVNSGGR